MDLYHALSENLIPVTDGLVDLARTCTLCGICDRQPTGDYALSGLENEIAIERKTLPDLVNSIIQERKGFIAKCEGLAAFKKKCIVIEGVLSILKTPYEDSQAIIEDIIERLP
jgi:ERCC4-type nuclease